VRNSSLVKCARADNVTGLKHITETMVQWCHHGDRHWR